MRDELSDGGELKSAAPIVGNHVQAPVLRSDWKLGQNGSPVPLDAICRDPGSIVSADGDGQYSVRVKVGMQAKGDGKQEEVRPADSIKPVVVLEQCLPMRWPSVGVQHENSLIARTETTIGSSHDEAASTFAGGDTYQLPVAIPTGTDGPVSIDPSSTIDAFSHDIEAMASSPSQATGHRSVGRSSRPEFCVASEAQPNSSATHADSASPSISQPITASLGLAELCEHADSRAPRASKKLISSSMGLEHIRQTCPDFTIPRQDAQQMHVGRFDRQATQWQELDSIPGARLDCMYLASVHRGSGGALRQSRSSPLLVEVDTSNCGKDNAVDTSPTAEPYIQLRVDIPQGFQATPRVDAIGPIDAHCLSAGVLNQDDDSCSLEKNHGPQSFQAAPVHQEQLVVGQSIERCTSIGDTNSCMPEEETSVVDEAALASHVTEAIDSATAHQTPRNVFELPPTRQELRSSPAEYNRADEEVPSHDHPRPDFKSEKAMVEVETTILTLGRPQANDLINEDVIYGGELLREEQTMPHECGIDGRSNISITADSDELIDATNSPPASSLKFSEQSSRGRACNTVAHFGGDLQKEQAQECGNTANQQEVGVEFSPPVQVEGEVPVVLTRAAVISGACGNGTNQLSRKPEMPDAVTTAATDLIDDGTQRIIPSERATAAPRMHRQHRSPTRKRRARQRHEADDSAYHRSVRDHTERSRKGSPKSEKLTKDTGDLDGRKERRVERRLCDDFASHAKKNSRHHAPRQISGELREGRMRLRSSPDGRQVSDRDAVGEDTRLSTFREINQPTTDETEPDERLRPRSEKRSYRHEGREEPTTSSSLSAVDKDLNSHHRRRRRSAAALSSVETERTQQRDRLRSGHTRERPAIPQGNSGFLSRIARLVSVGAEPEKLKPKAPARHSSSRGRWTDNSGARPGERAVERTSPRGSSLVKHALGNTEESAPSRPMPEHQLGEGSAGPELGSIVGSSGRQRRASHNQRNRRKSADKSAEASGLRGLWGALKRTAT